MMQTVNHPPLFYAVVAALSCFAIVGILTTVVFVLLWLAGSNLEETTPDEQS